MQQPIGELEAAAPESLRDFLRLLPRRRLWFHLARAVVEVNGELVNRTVAGGLWFPLPQSCAVKVDSLVMKLEMPSTVEVEILSSPSTGSVAATASASAAEPAALTVTANLAGPPVVAVNPEIPGPAETVRDNPRELEATPPSEKPDGRRKRLPSEWYQELEKRRKRLSDAIAPDAEVSQEELAKLLIHSRRRLYALDDRSDPDGEKRRKVISDLEDPARDLADEVRRHRAGGP
jgi:hypothetical protein